MGRLNLDLFKNIQKSQTQKDEKDIIDYVLDRGFFSQSEQDDILDLIEEIKYKKGKISKEGFVTCYYALSKYNKKSYEKEGTVGAGSDKIILSTSNTKDLKDFGDTILTLNIPIERLYFVAETKDALLLKIPFRNRNRRINIKEFV